MAKHKIRRKRRDEKRREGVVGLRRPLKAAGEGGGGGWRGGGGEGWRGSDVTTEIKSNANTKLHYPSRTLADPSSLPSCSHTLPGPATRPFLPVLSPSLRFSLVPFASSPLCLPPQIPPSVPGVWCAFSSRLHESPHRSHPPPGNNPLVERPPVRVSAAPPANLGETETIAAPTSTSCD